MKICFNELNESSLKSQRRRDGREGSSPVSVLPSTFQSPFCPGVGGECPNCSQKWRLKWFDETTATILAPESWVEFQAKMKGVKKRIQSPSSIYPLRSRFTMEEMDLPPEATKKIIGRPVSTDPDSVEGKAYPAIWMENLCAVGEIYFDNVKLSKDCLVGKKGDGDEIFFFTPLGGGS